MERKTHEPVVTDYVKTILISQFEAALAMGALLVLVSLSVLLTVRLLPSWTRFTSISLFPSAPSRSS